MARSEQNPSSGLSLSNHMAGGRGTQDRILPDQQLLHSISGSDPSNELDNLRVVIPSITTNDKGSTLNALGN